MGAAGGHRPAAGRPGDLNGWCATGGRTIDNQTLNAQDPNVERLTIAGVYVGRPAVLGTRRGREVTSAIVKQRVDAEELDLSTVNLAGDAQADTKAHGGPDKAVYVYPVEHFPAWRADGFPLEPGMVGENLSIAGADESRVRLGDQWAWGDAVVQVSQPRTPCFKLAMRTERRAIIDAMLRNGRCGWYLRVLRPGTVPTTGTLTLLARNPDSPTVAELHRAAHARADELPADEYRRLLERAVTAPDLADGWRRGMAAKLRRLGAASGATREPSQVEELQ